MQSQIRGIYPENLEFIPDGYFLCHIAEAEFEYIDIKFPSLTIPLQDESISFGQIVELYKLRSHVTEEMLGNYNIHLYIQKVGSIKKGETIYDIKYQLNNYSLDHLSLKLILRQNSSGNQCNQYFHFEQHPAYKNPQNYFEIFVKILQFGVNFYHMFNCESKVSDEITKLLEQRREYTEEILQQLQTQAFKIECQGCKYVIDRTQKVKSVLKQHPTISLFIFSIKIYKKIKEKRKQKPITIHVYHSFVDLIGTFEYHNIFDHKVYTLLHLCKVQNSKKKGLKIGNKILKPSELMSQLMSIFSYRNESCTYSCFVVTEYQLFYSMQPLKISRFNIQDYSGILKQEHINDIQLKRQSRIQQTQTDNFRQNSFFGPILMYTSSYMYRQFNQYLRKVNFYNLKNQQLNNQSKKWKFTFSLLNSLQKMPNYSGKVYRRVNYPDYIFKKGAIEFFKTFISTSVSQESALSFQKGNGTLFIIEGLTGKNISKYSYYPKEEQILFLPYSYFEVMDIDDNSPTLKKVYLRQIPVLHQRNSNVLLWVDDQINQGLSIYNNYKQTYPKMRTQLIQLLSNQHLQKWMKMFGYLIIENHQSGSADEESRKTSLITDMKRGSKLEEGIQTIKIVRKYLPDIDILVYIGNLLKTKETMAKHNLQLNDKLQVTHYPEYLKKFVITKVLSPKQMQNSNCQLI